MKTSNRLRLCLKNDRYIHSTSTTSCTYTHIPEFGKGSCKDFFCICHILLKKFVKFLS